jgi:hypothetical protein
MRRFTGLLLDALSLGDLIERRPASLGQVLAFGVRDRVGINSETQEQFKSELQVGDDSRRPRMGPRTLVA